MSELKPMTAHRAIYFMERFKKEEKLLGPNEQAAVDYVIAMLEAQDAQPAQAGHVPEASCGECGKKASDGWALYCVACMEKAGLPAQAGQVLTDEKLWEMWVESPSDVLRFARAIEQAVLAKRVPMTPEQINDAYGAARVQHDHIPHDDVTRIVRAAERHHGIVGEKGGA